MGKVENSKIRFYIVMCENQVCNFERKQVEELKGLEGLAFIDKETGGVAFALSVSGISLVIIDDGICCVLVSLGTVSIIL